MSDASYLNLTTDAESLGYTLFVKITIINPVSLSAQTDVPV